MSTVVFPVSIDLVRPQRAGAVDEFQEPRVAGLGDIETLIAGWTSMRADAQWVRK